MTVLSKQPACSTQTLYLLCEKVAPDPEGQSARYQFERMTFTGSPSAGGQPASSGGGCSQPQEVDQDAAADATMRRGSEAPRSAGAEAERVQEAEQHAAGSSSGIDVQQEGHEAPSTSMPVASSSSSASASVQHDSEAVANHASPIQRQQPADSGSSSAQHVGGLHSEKSLGVDVQLEGHEAPMRSMPAASSSSASANMQHGSDIDHEAVANDASPIQRQQPADSGSTSASSAQHVTGVTSQAAHVQQQPQVTFLSAIPNPDDERDTNLCYFRQFAACHRGPQCGHYEKVQTVSESTFGLVERHSLEVSGERKFSVVVKKMTIPLQCRHREADGRRETRTEDPYTEMGVLMYLQHRQPHPSLLRMYECFDVNQYTCLVTEDCRGGNLFDVVKEKSRRDPSFLTERVVRHCVGQVCSAVHYLHGLNVGCRDIGLENILVSDVGAMTLKVMDFGQAVLCRTRDGRAFRYFGQAGKKTYVPPEAHIAVDAANLPVLQKHLPLRPAGDAGSIIQVVHESGNVEIRLPASREGLPCVAELAGYRVEPFDSFSCGATFFCVAWQKPPWNKAIEEDACFRYVKSNGIARLVTDSFREPLLSPDGMDCIQGLLAVDPQDRWTLQQVLSSPWLRGGAARVTA